MYWLINKKRILPLTLGLIISSGAMACFNACTPEKNNDINTHASGKEIDIPQFFKSEVSRLNATKPSIQKTVAKDGAEETKTVTVKDWNVELASFMDVDLNKVAYIGTFQKDSVAEVVEYRFVKPDLDLSRIRITYNDHKPVAFTIEKSTDNLLYKTTEHLEYKQGVSYKVEKLQQVKFFNENAYSIIGKF
ncbi:hypothetical protein ACL9RF_05045 [Sphingobacterium sp. Mn56C]|uniref:hypothetical protein n=1 Tax=Sphingobacterium sp. Mn56C TaxID=3395261 RepID=UPI003BCC3133